MKMNKIKTIYNIFVNGENVKFPFDLEFAEEYKQCYLDSIPSANIEIKQI